MSSLRDSSEVDETINLLGLGTKLRALRLSKKISLVDLGKHTNLSPSMLSQLENGKLVPTLPTLTRIARVFGVGLAHFFVDTAQPKLFHVLRSSDRVRMAEDPDSNSPTYFFECLAFSATDRAFHGYLAHFPMRETHSEFHLHDGFEMLYVIDGALEICSGDRTSLLAAGDSVFFDSTQPHAYRGVSEEPARALVVCTVPTRI